MKKKNSTHIPAAAEIIKGIEKYEENPKREPMYNTTLFIHEFWGKCDKMADALGVLLLTWNKALYRYGSFDFDRLEECI